MSECQERCSVVQFTWFRWLFFFCSSEPASILEHSTTHHPCGRWICIFPYRRAHCCCCCCCCCEEPLKQTYISVCWGRRRNVVLCAKPSLEAFSQICWEMSRLKANQALSLPGICTTNPVGAYFGECLCSQRLKRPGDTGCHSGILQDFLYCGN